MPKKLYPHICDYCGKEHSISTSTYNKLINGKSKHCYCSTECKANAQRRGDYVICANCGKKFYKKPSEIKQQENLYCCTECEFEHRKKVHREERTCEICGKTFVVGKRSKQRFCSPECKHEWQTQRVGEKSSHFIPSYSKCDYCGKMFHISLYNQKTYAHHFCSLTCRQKWYSEVFSQDDNWKEKSRIKMLETLTSGKISLTNSLPQRLVDEMLTETNVPFEREKTIDFYSVDNFLLGYNLIIEVQGDYWHYNPTTFTTPPTKMQIKNRGRDKAKHNFIKHKYGIEILYLWEYDIVHNKELCVELIKKYIINQGNLENYHSFNYNIIENQLCIKDNITTA